MEFILFFCFIFLIIGLVAGLIMAIPYILFVIGIIWFIIYLFGTIGRAFGYLIPTGIVLSIVLIFVLAGLAEEGEKNNDKHLHKSAQSSADSSKSNPSIGTKAEELPYLGACPIIESDSYQGNQGDSYIGVIEQDTSIDGTTYTHGIKAGIARWNYEKEISWAYAVFKLEPGYRSLSGRVTLIESYNTDNFDTTLYFYDGDRLIDSFWLSPQSIPFEFSIDITDVEKLKILVEDNVAVEGGTCFGFVNAVLSTEKQQTKPSADNSGNKKVRPVYLDERPVIESDSYQGNAGDSFVDIIGRNYNTRGNTSIDGTTYTHGIEAWIARWNEIKEISWAYAVFKLEPGYRSLSGRVTLIESYNTDNFDSTLYFYDGDRLIDSFRLSPQSIPFDFSIDISDVEELKILVEDNEAVEGGTSFGIVDAVLSSEEEK